VTAVPQDLDAALRLYKRAAKGHADAAEAVQRIEAVLSGQRSA
jgi:hypothetical protein